MKKILLVLALCLALCACTGPQAKTTTDLSTIIAEATYASAAIYYEQNKAAFSPQDAILFEYYLTGFRLALDQGQCVQAMVDQWRQFYNAPIYLDDCQADTPKQ